MGPGRGIAGLPTVDFQAIRQHETSQQRAFEELCYLLVPTIHQLPPGSRLHRRKPPDGGIEFWCDAPDANGKWAWQAKYLFNVDASAFGQMRRSILSALDRTPDLTRYIFVLPTDLTGPAERAWDRNVGVWTEMAADKGMAVDFKFVGHSDLLIALLEPKHAGAVRYFFDRALLAPSFFTQQVDREIRNLGRRYRPEVHVDVEISADLEGVARSDQWRAALDGVRDRVRLYEVKDPNLGDEIAAAVNGLRGDAQSLLERISNDWDALLDPTDTAVGELRNATQRLASELDACEQLVRDATLALPDDTDGKQLRSAGYRLQNELWSVRAQVHAVEAQLAADEGSNGALVLEGPAGCGKSHLLGDLAIRRVARGAPTILLLGQHFERGDPWPQIADQLGLSLERDDMLAALEVAAAVSGKGRCLLIIDAINEHAGMDVWPSRLAGFLSDVAAHPWIAVVLSVRSTYAEQILGNTSIRRLKHPGLEGHEEEALARFAGVYGIGLADLPPMLPELANPLFLESLCRVIAVRGVAAVPRDAIGVSWIFDGLIATTEDSLRPMLGFASAEHPVWEFVRQFALEMISTDGDGVPYDDARRISQNVLDRGPRHDQSLLAALLREGLLLEETGRDGPVVRFTYQRLGDHLVAAALTERLPDLLDLRTEVERLVGLPHGWRLRGVLEALSITVPETHQVELMDALEVPPKRRPAEPQTHRSILLDGYELTTHLLRSLEWRRAESITSRTLDLATTAIASGLIDEQEWFDVLVRLACVPDHPLNIQWTDQRLRKLDLPTRDRAWSILAVGIPELPTSVHRVLQWCIQFGWSASDQVRPLAGDLLSWLLACPDRRVRDRATKALLAVFEKHPDALADLLERFAGVDDESITERLLAVACGWALRHRHDPQHPAASWDRLLAAAFDMGFGGSSPTEHLLARNYARQTVRIAAAVVAAAGLQPSRDAAATDSPPATSWPLDAPSRRSLERAYGPDGEWNVIREWDDFYRYVIERALRDFLPEGQSRLRAARRRRLKRRQTLADAAWVSATAPLTDAEVRAISKVVRSARNVDGDLAEISPALALAWREVRSATWELDRGDDPVRVDPGLVARLVSARVLDLGWTQERFGRVDRALGRARGTDGPVERVGKKYAWIALYEALGRIADHSLVLPEFGAHEPGPYEGPWQVGGAMDIDPSHVLVGSGLGLTTEPDARPWWHPPTHQLHAHGDDAAWLRDTTDVPEPRTMLVRIDPRGRKWVVLEGHFEWERDAGRPKTGMTRDRREMWIRSQTYLVQASDVATVRSWASTRNWMGLDVPLGGTWHDAYHGSYPDVAPWPAFFAGEVNEGQSGADGWVHHRGLSPRLLVATAGYGFDRDRDYSGVGDMTTSSILPTRELLALLDARWLPAHGDLASDLRLGPNEVERAWFAGDDIVAFYAGPRNEFQPSALLCRADAVGIALERVGMALWGWFLGEKHYWLEGEPTRKRQELFGAAQLAPGEWEEWGRSIEFVDHETGDRASLEGPLAPGT